MGHTRATSRSSRLKTPLGHYAAALTRSWGFPTALLGIIACNKANNEHAIAAATIDTLKGGIVRVQNNGPTRWPDTNGWRIVLVAERTFPASGPGAMEHPNFPTPLADGSVIVVNQKPVYLSHFSATLEPLGNFSREGDGPGEVRSPRPISARDSIFVVDQNRAVIIAFDRAGHFAHETSIGWRVEDVGNVVHDRVALSGSVGRRSDGVIWWDLGNNTASDSVLPPPGPEPFIIARCSVGLPYQPEEQIAAVAPGRAWWGVSDADRFIATHNGRDTTIVTSSSRPRVQVSDSVLDRMFAPDGWISKACGPTPERSNVPKMKPAWSELLADDSTNLWVYRAGLPHASFDVYGADGHRLGAVPDPFRTDENWWWHGDHPASVEEHDDGSFTLRIYRIERRRGA